MRNKTKFGELTQAEIDILKANQGVGGPMLAKVIGHVIELAETEVEYVLPDESMKAVKAEIERGIKQGKLKEWLEYEAIPKISDELKPTEVSGVIVSEQSMQKIICEVGKRISNPISKMLNNIYEELCELNNNLRKE